MSNENNLPKKILIVDDDAAVANALKAPLAGYNVTAVSATELDTAIYLFNQNRFEVVVVEQEFDPLPGLVLIQKWRKHEDPFRAGVGVILLSGNRSLANSASEAALLREMGGVELMFKPITPIQLLPVLSRTLQAVKKAALYKETKDLVDKLAAKPETMEKAIATAKAKIPELGQQAMLMLLELYNKAGRSKEALQLVDGMLVKDQSNLFLLNQKAKLLMALGEFTQALTFMEQADKVAPQNIERIEDMADLYLKLNKPDDSVKKMKELIDLSPEQPNLKFDMFAKLTDAGFDGHAQGLCKATTDPMEVIRYYNNKGVALSKSGNVDGAISEYERSLKFYPKFRENYRILYNIALAFVSKKNRDAYQSALSYVERALDLSPNFEKGLATRESLTKALGSKKAAATTADAAKAPAASAAGKPAAAQAPAKKPETKAAPAKGAAAKTDEKAGTSPKPELLKKSS